MIVQDGYIIAVESGDEHLDDIFMLLEKKPTDPEGYRYLLKQATLSWELVENAPDPNPDLADEEALAIILGGGDA